MLTLLRFRAHPADETCVGTTMHERRLRVAGRGDLSPAELDVVRAAARGLTARETAQALHKAADTVKTQRVGAINKLGARNMTHAVHLATASGLLDAA